MCSLIWSPSGELLPCSHPADEDEPHLLLVPRFPLLLALSPPGGAVPTGSWWPALCDGDQRHRCGHGREEQLLRCLSYQLDGGAWQPAALAVRPIKTLLPAAPPSPQKRLKMFLLGLPSLRKSKKLFDSLHLRCDMHEHTCGGQQYLCIKFIFGCEESLGSKFIRAYRLVWNSITIYSTWTHCRCTHLCLLDCPPGRRYLLSLCCHCWKIPDQTPLWTC